MPVPFFAPSVTKPESIESKVEETQIRIRVRIPITWLWLLRSIPRTNPHTIPAVIFITVSKRKSKLKYTFTA